MTTVCGPGRRSAQQDDDDQGDDVDLELDGKVAVITGGSDGLGLAAARGYVAAGGRVTLVGRSPERLEAAREQLGHAAGSVHTVAGDVTADGVLETAVGSTVERWGRLDGLVNGAGVATGGSFEEVEDATWRADFELKLMAMIRGTRLAVPHLRRTRGAVVNVLSVWARFQGVGSMPSSVYRAAGLALTKGTSKDLGKDGIRVNAILPGEVRSGQWRRLVESSGLGDVDLEARQVEASGIPLGRVGDAEDFADLALFLLSPRSGYLTGVGVNLDGGLSPVT
jgi:NAD(P)-dependent dehydrogenase (short-subunit alcohol dehydrogenase family)